MFDNSARRGTVLRMIPMLCGMRWKVVMVSFFFPLAVTLFLEQSKCQFREEDLV
jgi:hypothetical protein